LEALGLGGRAAAWDSPARAGRRCSPAPGAAGRQPPHLFWKLSSS